MFICICSFSLTICIGNMKSSILYLVLPTFLLVVALQVQHGFSAKVIDMSGTVYDKKCCRDKADQYIKKAKTEGRGSQGYCAVLFENAACDSCRRVFSGWDKGIKSGKEKFGRLSRYREDSTSVIVAPGCIFVGYDESDEDDDNKRTIASAIGRRDWVYKEFKELKNDIERVECFCGTDAANKLAKEIDRMTRAKCEGNKMKFLGAGLGGAALSGVASNMISKGK